jgi:hypothetical protein
VSSNKDGVVSRGAMMMTIELRIDVEEKHCLHGNVRISRADGCGIAMIILPITYYCVSR